MKRKAEIKRKTKETQIQINLNLDGKGKTKLEIEIELLKHLLELFAFHGLFDLEIKAKALDKNRHHLNEDLGISLGEAFKKALGDKAGIKRFSWAAVPMEEVLAWVVVDISGRASFNLILPENFNLVSSQDYSFQEAVHFLESFAKHLGINLYIKLERASSDLHTSLEPIFKALGLSLASAVQIDLRRKGIPSTKGLID